MPSTDIGYFEAFGVDEALLARVLSRALSRGGDFADLFFEHVSSTAIGLEDGEVNRAYTRVELGCGIRVVVGDQTGYAFTEDLASDALLAAADTAAAIAAVSPGDVVQPFVRPDLPDHYPVARPWSDVDSSLRIPLLSGLDERCRGLDPRVRKVTVSYADAERHILVATSDGILAADEQPMTRMVVGVTAEQDGVRQSNSANVAAREGIGFYDPARLDALARKTVDRTLVLFDAVRPPAGELPVVLAAGSSGILLHEAIGHGLEADHNRKRISIFADMIGRSVAEPFVSIVDDGTNPHMRGSINVDDEGNPVERTVLVEDGVLRGYLHDRISAAHYGVPVTGSGRRQSFRYPPLPRMRNTYMLPGPHTRDEIIASVDRGILAETFTNGQVQIGAGDFTFYIKNGWLIEGGELIRPIKDANIIGNGPDVLRKMTMVADDLRLDDSGWTCGKDGQMVPVGLGLPTTLVSGITVGGVNG